MVRTANLFDWQNKIGETGPKSVKTFRSPLKWSTKGLAVGCTHLHAWFFRSIKYGAFMTWEIMNLRVVCHQFIRLLWKFLVFHERPGIREVSRGVQMQNSAMLWLWTFPISLLVMFGLWLPLEGSIPGFPQPKEPFRSVDDRIIRTPLQPLVDTATHILWDPNMLVTSYHGLQQLKTMFSQWRITVPGVAMLPFMGYHFKSKRDLSSKMEKHRSSSSWLENKDQALDRLTEQLGKYHYLY